MSHCPATDMGSRSHRACEHAQVGGKEPHSQASNPLPREKHLVQSERLQWPWAILAQAVEGIMEHFASYQTLVQESLVLEF